MGSLFYAFFILPIQLIVYLLLHFLQKFEAVKKFRKNMWNQMFWNGLIATFKEGFVIAFLCFLINVLSVSIFITTLVLNTKYLAQSQPSFRLRLRCCIAGILCIEHRFDFDQV